MQARASQEMQPSLLDRLIDLAPDENGIESERMQFTLRNLRHSVRRDLENLLNAKVNWRTWPECYSELDQSLFSYGLPDFSSMPLSSLEGRQALCQIIENTIRKFEPRFADVDVSILDDDQPLDRIMRLRINALIHADPVPEEITFDSEVEPVSLGMRIQEA